MKFQCKNCGGNMVFSPKDQTLICPQCNTKESFSLVEDASLTNCPSCGGELNLGEFTSASRCPYCNNYLVYEDRISGQYQPDKIIPFKITKDQAVSFLSKEFMKRVFTPLSFLSQKTLVNLNGYYVPFFLYDYEAIANYQGVGIKIRTWRSGNYDYTEKSFYDVARQMHASYDNIPVDASFEMNDSIMDLMEPYDYKQLMDFNPIYLSGFFGEIYNDNPLAFKPRADEKASASAQELIKRSLSGYASLNPPMNTIHIDMTDGNINYVLFPVWVYKYTWGNKTYPFYINGQTGKVIGNTPVSKVKALIYSISLGGFLYIIFWTLRVIWEVL